MAADGGRGIKCDSVFVMTNGSVNATLLGGTLIETADTSRCMAINVGEDMTLSGGTINVSICNDEAKSHKVKGTMNVSGDAMMTVGGNRYTSLPHDYQYDKMLYAIVHADGTPIQDYANYQIGAFVGNDCRGSAIVTTVRDNTTYLSMRLRSNSTAAGEVVGFRVWDASKGIEYTAKEAISFKSQTITGTPSSPFVLNITTRKRGDIDGDDEVDIHDLALYVKGLLGLPSPTLPDIDDSGTINLEDAKAIADIILGR